jgi:hypothetical protein
VTAHALCAGLPVTNATADVDHEVSPILSRATTVTV